MIESWDNFCKVSIELCLTMDSKIIDFNWFYYQWFNHTKCWFSRLYICEEKSCTIINKLGKLVICQNGQQCYFIYDLDQISNCISIKIIWNILARNFE